MSVHTGGDDGVVFSRYADGPKQPTLGTMHTSSPAASGTAAFAPRTLIVVDVQNDFCEGGALGVAGGVATAQQVAELLAGEHGYDLLVATRDRHIDPGAHFAADPDFVDTWPPHCVAGTSGAELHAELAAASFDEVFDKGAYSAAYSGFEGFAAAGAAEEQGPGLADWLRSRGVQAVDVCGIATDHCVRATAADALAAGFQVRVLADLTAAVDVERGRAALADLAAAGAEIRGEVPSP